MESHKIGGKRKRNITESICRNMEDSMRKIKWKINELNEGRWWHRNTEKQKVCMILLRRRELVKGKNIINVLFL